MKNNSIISIVLIAGILILVNILSNRFFFRLDLTEGQQYTLSKATKDIIKGLDAPITVTSYFSKNLPVDIVKIQRDFEEMLLEYSTMSKGNLNYQFVSPETDEEKTGSRTKWGPTHHDTGSRKRSGQESAGISRSCSTDGRAKRSNSPDPRRNRYGIQLVYQH